MKEISNSTSRVLSSMGVRWLADERGGPKGNGRKRVFDLEQWTRSLHKLSLKFGDAALMAAQSHLARGRPGKRHEKASCTRAKVGGVLGVRATLLGTAC